MTRTLTSGMQTVATADVVRPIFLVQLLFDDVYNTEDPPELIHTQLYLWNGIGDLTVDSVTYVGTGTLLDISSMKESSDLTANGMSLTLSGVTEPLISKARDVDYQGREVKIFLGAMDATNTVIADPALIFSGFMDTMIITDGAETATIRLTVENRLIEFQRSRIRRYTAEDQKIDYPADKGLEFVAEMSEKEIVWGKPIGAGGISTSPGGPPDQIDEVIRRLK